MKRKLLRFSSILATLAFLIVFFGLAVTNTPSTTAVKATDFKAGRIIDDNVFYNSNTMTAAQIQSFMDGALPACDMWGTGKIGNGYYINGKAVDSNTTRAEYARRMRTEAGDSRYHEPPYVCINKYYENPTTHESNFDTKGVVKDGMISAAQIIYNAAKEYNINPQVLLVMLKKESYAWGDNWPTKNEYNTIMGYACPDHAACDTNYYGFYNQVHTAAWQLDYYKKNIYSYNYRPYVTNKIYYSPTASCGSKNVYIENYATASLYIYTPYTPNDAALRNYPGTSTCGSYGNRNFFMYFNEWFGSTLFSTSLASVGGGNYYIRSSNDSTKYLIFNSATTNTYAVGFGVKPVSGSGNELKVQKNSDNSYSIINAKLNVALDATTAPEEKVIIKPSPYSATSASQKWIIYDNGNGSYSFSPLNNKTVALTYDGTSGQFVLSTYTRATWQKFNLESYVAPATTGNTAPTTPITSPTQNEPKEEAPQGGSQTQQPQTQTVPQELASGTYSFVSSLNYTSAMSLVNDKTVNGTNVHLWNITNKPSQKYDIQYDAASRYYTFKNLLSGKYLTARSSTITDKTQVMIYTQTTACSQKWKITKNSDGTFMIASACNDTFVLDVENGKSTNGTRILLRKKSTGKAQKFTFIKYEGASLNGQYFIRSGSNSNFVVDVSGGKFRNGSNIQLYKANKSVAQKFTLKHIASCDCYNIVSYNSNFSIDVKNGSKANGANIWIYKNNSTAAQRWYIVKGMDGFYRIRNIGSRKMLNLNANKIGNGININLWQDGNANSQRWRLERIK